MPPLLALALALGARLLLDPPGAVTHQAPARAVAARHGAIHGAPHAGDTVVVAVRGFRYVVPPGGVRAGRTVAFVNEDEIEHTVSFDSMPSRDHPLPSATLPARGSRHVFTAVGAGSYTFRCARHPFMTGALQVTDSAAWRATPTHRSR